MSLLDDVSIVVTPNGYKAGELYAVIPSNGDADMDVTRATDATRVDENGLIEDVLSNVPRIDYTGGGCPHILAEPQRTNLLPYSEDFSDSNWSKQSGITPTYNTTETLSPDGTHNATKFIGTGSTGVYDSGISVSGNITRSVYLKSVSGTTTAVFKDPNATGGATDVNLTITNDWQRFELIGDNGTASQGLWIDDITSDGLYMWGAQLEEGSYSTSYIPTSGSTVTRNQDIFTRDGIGSLINSTEGVLFVEMAALSNDLTNRRITISDGVGGNDVGFRFNNSSNTIQVVSYINSSVIVNESYVLSDITVIKKYALKWALNNYALWVDGVEVITDISAISFPADTLNTLNFGSATGSSPFFGKVKQLQVYDTALTDDQLEDLTS
jgi:hypothetical protein